MSRSDHADLAGRRTGRSGGKRRLLRTQCVDDARRVAAALEIPYYVMNFKKEFKEM